MLTMRTTDDGESTIEKAFWHLFQMNQKEKKGTKHRKEKGGISILNV